MAARDGASDAGTQVSGTQGINLAQMWRQDPVPSISGIGDGLSSVGPVGSTASEQVRQMNKDRKKKQTAYVCGKCSEETALDANDPVRCESCGHRILYKKRGNIPVQYEAR
eukprot:Hpha_TRINITY_DN1639_c0_g1::TRINITY_DN1639_c0_g1_i1::g.48858::m.48858